MLKMFYLILKNPMDNSNNLQKIKDLLWKEVFEIWRTDEENVEHWKDFWAARRFKSWREWREKTHVNLRGPELKWALYGVLNPLEEVPNWRGGMFHGWAKWFYPVFPEQPPCLRDLLAHPGVHNNWLIRELAHNFPKETSIMAIRDKNGDIFVAEGMHRCCALAMAAYDNIPVQTDLEVSLADWPFGDLPRLGNGWEKENS
ncbi:MAG: Uncharacterized protein CEN90_607 [Parcubacteria group bacterium Licking1014_17]|nr:MAG: Uncharacterized protein CEN90_607 [Parcubacteria group bacterium Licking1014_17]